jgi:hypothetical protein
MRRWSVVRCGRAESTSRANASPAMRGSEPRSRWAAASASRSSSQMQAVVKRSPLGPSPIRTTRSVPQVGVGGALDLDPLAAVRERLAEGLDRLPAVEVGGVLCHRAVHRLEGEPGRGGLAVVPEQDHDLDVELDLARPLGPALAQRGWLQLALLGGAGGEGGGLAGGARSIGASRGGEDLGPPGRELAQLVVLEAPELGDPVANLLPLGTEASDQPVAEQGLVEVAGGLGVLVDRGVVEAGPAPVRALGRVGDQHVGVELGVAGAGGAVAVGGGEVARALDEPGAAAAAPRPAGLALQVGEGGVDRALVGVPHRGARPLVSERPQQRDRLRRREGEIEAGDGALAAGDAICRDQRRAARGVAPGEHRPQGIGLDLSGEAELARRRRASCPWPRPRPSSSPRRRLRPSPGSSRPGPLPAFRS